MAFGMTFNFVVFYCGMVVFFTIADFVMLLYYTLYTIACYHS